MIKRLFLVQILLWGLVFESSCSAPPLVSGELESSFAEMFPVENINNDLQFSPLNDFGKGISYSELIELVLQNYSKERISFQPNEDVRYFVIVKGEWIEIQDNLQHDFLGGDIVLSPKDTSLKDFYIIVAMPEFSRYLSSLDIPIVRVFVNGEIMKDENDSNQSVATYYDVPIAAPQ